MSDAGLEKIIELCRTKRGLEVEGEASLYSSFLRRQFGAHSDYVIDLGNLAKSGAVASFIADKLLVFAYLMRKHRVKQPEVDSEPTLIDNFDKLHLLRVPGRDYGLWCDRALYLLYIRSMRSKLMRYTAIVDEVGADQEVVKLWGRKLTYAGDVSYRTRGKTRGRRSLI